MTLTEAQQAQLCQTCVADPTAAPGRYCARFCCRCGHPTCPAYQSWTPLSAREPLPENVIHLTSHPTEHEPSAWDQRDEASWIDKL